jgi:hypothetical protein
VNNPNAYYYQMGTAANPGLTAQPFAIAARNTQGTPDINNWDFAIKKRVNITERQSIEFDFQATNIFNHAQYVPGYISDIAGTGSYYAGSTVRGYATTGSPTFNMANQVFSNHPRNVVLVLKYAF